ncbi:hypothetical protein [Shimia sagamensis]|uniref:Uncharacterized protein n=1 Tax=Shimia sagamensis TaxID=1566352 RepID=A0ABY1PDU1_9RHOB|nr:hypothetical protein [Shimia sagamensis]SMP32250.1 hypothetical protein SAMN06265373_108148 [Shimia sagamensis]
MKLIDAMEVTEAVLAGSSISEDEHPPYDPVVTYAKDVSVLIEATHRVYRSVVDDNTGNDPTVLGSIYWVEVSATNLWKPFDNLVTDQAEGASPLWWSLAPNQFVNALAVFNIEDADDVTVQVYSEGTEVATYDQTLELVDNSMVDDWHAYFFQPIERFAKAVFTDLPAFEGDAVDVTVTSGDGTPKVGQIVLGLVHTIGTTQEGVTASIEDFSIKEDDAFGRPTVVERSYKTSVDYPVAIATERSAYIQRLLARRRATPTAYFPDSDLDRFGVSVFGFFEDFTVTLSGSPQSEVSITIEGLEA